MKAGLYPGFVAGEDEFPLQVVSSAPFRSDSASTWISPGYQEAFSASGQQDESIAHEQITQVQFSASPNPFNAATVISLTLPDRLELTVQVFNIAGQQVATLANGQFTAGTHELSFNANNLASGLYFVRAAVPGQFEQMQKVMLVR